MIDEPGGFIDLGEVRLDAGPHSAGLSFGGADLHAGSGGFPRPEAGPLLFEPAGAEAGGLVSVPPAEASAALWPLLGLDRGGRRRMTPPFSLDSRLAALLALAVAVAVSGVWLFSLDSQLTFIADDWMLLVKRQGWGASYFLKPFHGNIVVAPALVYKLMREIFGMGSATPYYVAAILSFLSSAVLLFVYLRRRVGAWLALIAAVLVLFLGAAFEDLLFAFQIGYFGSVAAGLGMLIALDREDDHGDRLACLLLVASLAFSSVGLAFAAGALLDLLAGRRPSARRAYFALAPIALYCLWWIGWGHTAQNQSALTTWLTPRCSSSRPPPPASRRCSAWRPATAANRASPT